jgi:CTP:molybdopterin cytidylyltransferase MocA
MLSAGATLFISRSQRSANHLWVVVTEPDGDPRQCGIVSLTTRRQGSDDTVVLMPGDHPFVVRETVVSYANARLARTNQLENLVTAGATQTHAACSPELLERIRAGLFASPFTPGYVKGYCGERLGGSDGQDGE